MARGLTVEALAIIIRGDAEVAVERAAQRLGGTEAAPLGDGCGGERLGFEQASGRVEAHPLDVVRRWDADLLREHAGEVALAHPDPRGEHRHPVIVTGRGVDEVLRLTDGRGRGWFR